MFLLYFAIALLSELYQQSGWLKGAARDAGPDFLRALAVASALSCTIMSAQERGLAPHAQETAEFSPE